MLFDEKCELLGTAMVEIEKRLSEGDVESSLSIARAALIAVRFGFDSPEFRSFIAIEKARIESA